MKEDSTDPETTPPSHVTLIGGARVGIWNATWPFARLRISADELDLWVLGPGALRFPKAAVVRVTKHISLPLIGWGVRIEHEIPGYDETVIFWSFRNPGSILRVMMETGFLTDS